MLRYFIFTVLVILVVYGLVKAWPLLAGPSLSIVSPTDNAAYPGGIVVVRGTVERASSLIINGATVLHDQNGDFSSTLTFPHGGSILNFVATDRFGRKVTETRSIFVP